jgi:hypothetical protein
MFDGPDVFIDGITSVIELVIDCLAFVWRKVRRLFRWD